MKNISLPFSVTALLMLLLSGVPVLRADVKMPAIFGDHMVLQQDSKIPVWGWAAPGEKVNVALGTKTADTTADAQGKWRVDLPPLPAGSTAQTLKITGKNVIQIQDVLVGDVWLCSGQSNMQFGLMNEPNAADELKKADEPQIRIFYVPMKAYIHPQGDIAVTSKNLEGKWLVCTPFNIHFDGNWGGFSAVAFYFGREIHQFTGKPVGLIGSYWGATPAQAWTSLEALEKYPALDHFVKEYQTRAARYTAPDAKYKDIMEENDAEMAQWKAEVEAPFHTAMANWQLTANEYKAIGQPPPPKPTLARPGPGHPGLTASVLFNGMVAPLIPFGLKGVIWYQGEANEGNGLEYGTLFPAMITDWRERWGESDFPFLFVQLANYRQPATKPCEGNWAWVRDSQLHTLSLPNTGMASAIDIGNPNDIHPKDKADVAARLALAAKQVAYGQKDIVYSGPLYDSMRQEGEQIRIHFTQVGSGLTIGTPPWTWNGKPVPPPTELTGFAIAGADKKWYWAHAVIDGDGVVVSSNQVPNPVAVRYGWADNPRCNLYNKEKLPASPFRTDSWPN
ncbi:MAG: sialate O-acetylesterase [Methylacidiphilales bacterium]|nr:sialate O-acetylesterase [Candidatus Methylacidiphilales bacterium]